MAETAVATAQPKTGLALMKKQIDQMGPEFAKALPGHITAERFVRTAQTAITLTRNIEKANPASLMAACSKAAADGLILDGREAALVVDYNGDVQYRPMMRGLLKLAYNSGMVKTIAVEPVREADYFKHIAGDNPSIEHEINHREERGAVFLIYAIATLTDGAIIRELMTTSTINAIRDRSDAYKAFKKGTIKSTPWSTDWEEMARKTVFRRLSKYIPSSSDRSTFHQAVERIDEDYTFDVDDDAAPQITAPQPAPKKRGGAAAALKDVTPKADPKPELKAKDQPPHDKDTGEIIEQNDSGMPPYDDDDQRPSDDI